MDDDDLMLNFSTDTPVESTQVKVKGGRWKDRRKLQLSLQGRKPKPKSTGVNSIEINETKRRKIDQPRNTKFTETKGEFGGKNDSYVSSLFTNNQDTQLKITKDESVTHTPSNAPVKDLNSFNDLLNPKLSNHLIEHLRFKYPTKVQKLVIPKLLISQSDLFVKAQTGSGKTLAYLLPIMNQLMNENRLNRESGVFAMILTPTRELATQIYQVLESLVRCYHHIVPGIVIGGEKKKSEKARLRKGVNILVGTPGRLADHLENTKILDVSQLRYLILDEGDKLIELGFEETITKITSKIESSSEIEKTVDQWKLLPNKRINILCSATLQNNVKKLGQMILNQPEMISVENEVENTITFEDNTHSTAPDQLIQDILVVPPKLRLVTLSALLKNISETVSKTIVFFSCSDSVDYHFDVFTRDGKSISESEESGFLTAPLISKNSIIYKLHGSLSQQLRTNTLQSFIKDKNDHNKVLFCTDVASRGLDLPNITNVIEYDAPFTIDDHLHRIGRSARVGNQGNAALFLLPGIEEGYVDGKLKVVHPKKGSMRIVDFEVPLQQAFGEDEETKSKNEKQGKWDIHATTWHLDVERWVLENKAVLEKAIQAFTSHIRAYATHLNTEKEWFNVKTLHLGHLAKSFALRETPKKMGKSLGTTTFASSKTKKEDPKKKMLRMAKLAANSLNSEFNY